MRWTWAVLAMFAFGAAAAEVTVMSVGAVKVPFTDVTEQWSNDTGHKVSATYDPAGPLRQKIASGMRGDIVILPVESFTALEIDGLIVPGSRRDLGAVSMGAAVKEGAPVPDISTVEALKNTLRNARSVTYMDPERGTSGKHFDTSVLPRLGMRDEVRAKTKLGQGGSVGAGEGREGRGPAARAVAVADRLFRRGDEGREESGRGATAPRLPHFACQPKGLPRQGLYGPLSCSGS